MAFKSKIFPPKLQEKNNNRFISKKLFLQKPSQFSILIKNWRCVIGVDLSIITRYILKEHVGPFVFAVVTIVFVFLLNIIFRDLGRLIGKGLPVMVVLEFFALNLAWIVALAVPMSVLVAALMAFGRLSSDSEIAALKASGIHFYRLIAPVLIVAGFLYVGMERFNNTVLPEFNHRVSVLYSDITRKRPTLTLEPHVFFDEIPHYSLIVHDLKNEGNRIEGIIINDDSNPKLSKTIIAESGSLVFSDEQEKMIFTLFNAEVHEVQVDNLESYRRMRSNKLVFSIPVSNMVLKRSESQHRGQREKSAKMLRDDVKKNREALRLREVQLIDLTKRKLDEVFSDGLWATDAERRKGIVQDQRNVSSISMPLKLERLYNQVEGEANVIDGYKRAISSLLVEIYKKYSIPFACIVFVLVGAPLGIMARQGGLAIGGVLSLAFFLIYWTFLIGGEQLADRRIVDPVIAMWAPNLLVGAGGIYLVVRTVKEVTFISWDGWKRWFQLGVPREDRQ